MDLTGTHEQLCAFDMHFTDTGGCIYKLSSMRFFSGFINIKKT